MWSAQNEKTSLFQIPPEKLTKLEIFGIFFLEPHFLADSAAICSPKVDKFYATFRHFLTSKKQHVFWPFSALLLSSKIFNFFPKKCISNEGKCGVKWDLKWTKKSSIFLKGLFLDSTEVPRTLTVGVRKPSFARLLRTLP